MPRENVHWSVAEDALLLAEQDAPAVASCLNQHRPAWFLGAMAHDAPYYYRLGGDPFEACAEFLHGSEGNDSFVPLRVLARVLASGKVISPSAEAWAFLLGMVSHAVTDWTFHPMVYYLTGDYYHDDPAERQRARTRHRLFETLMDNWVGEQRKFWNRGLLSVCMKDVDILQICRLLDAVCTPEVFSLYGNSVRDLDTLTGLRISSVAGRWGSSLQMESVLQSFFISRLGSKFARGLRGLMPEKIAPYEALFNGSRLSELFRFEKPFRYRNPVTGEEEIATVNELSARAAAEYAELLKKFEPIVAGDVSDTERRLMDIRGKSLNFGIPRAKTTDARYFSAHGIDLPELSF